MAANWWYRRGGLGAVMFDETEALRRRGHEVVPFAAAHPENEPTEWSPFFPAYVEMSALGRGASAMTRARVVPDLIHNSRAARRFADLLDATRPDLIHLHNTARQLSPAILGAARARGVRAVMTLHDYGLICPQGQLYKAERAACGPPNCVRGNVVHAIANRCVKRSLAGSTIAAVEHLIHRSLRSYTDSVTALIAPSEFLRARLEAAGIRRPPIRVVPNGVHDAPTRGPVRATGGHILFSGRLAREKGVRVLLDAAANTPEIRYVVAGDGPLREDVERSAPDNVHVIGHQGPLQLDQLYADAVASVVPSTWFENAPLTVLEAMRAGRPVVASRLGGHIEMIPPNAGILVRPGDPHSLADAATFLWRNRSAAAAMGAAARRTFEKRYRLDEHVDRLLLVYGEAVSGG